MLLASPASAMDDPWDCSTPADLVEMRAIDWGHPYEVYAVALAEAEAWLDGSCTESCDDPGTWNAECRQGSCTTTAGAEVTYFYGSTSGSETVLEEVTVTVSLPADAGASWTELAVSLETRDHQDELMSSDDATLTMSWSGTLAEGWPADEAVSFTTHADVSSVGESWHRVEDETFAGTGCAWSWSTGYLENADTCNPAYDYTWETDMNGTVAVVEYDVCDDCRTPGWYAGTFDGAWVGTVDRDTWGPSASTDSDGDGFYVEDFDCDDTDPAIHPCADDVPYDGTDADCVGDDDFDGDADGHRSQDYGGDDCDDTSPWVAPGRAETECDGIDSDCDGLDPCPEDTGGTLDTGEVDTGTLDTAAGDRGAEEATLPGLTSAEEAEEGGCTGGRRGGCGGGGAAWIGLGASLLMRRREYGRPA